jgi:RHS repeat-associated protein
MTTYSYDRENRLISQNVDGNVTSFAYDGFGRKRRESRGVNPDVILNWDGDQMIVESSDLDPEAPSKAYYVADGVIYAENANLGSEKSRRDYAVDYLGSVTGLTAGSDASLSSVRRWSAYGKLLSGSSEPIGYFWTGNTGSRVHQSLGLNDNRARHYGRNIKQWITRDPLWPSELPYAYVGGNPVTWIDPSGKFGLSFGSDCGQDRRDAINMAMNHICVRFRQAITDCLTEESCTNDLSKFDALCNSTVDINQTEKVRIGCPDGRHRACWRWFRNRKVCGAVEGYSIILCPAAFEDPSCSPLWCSLLHELIHTWGNLGHTGRVWKCIKSIPSCKNSNIE